MILYFLGVQSANDCRRLCIDESNCKYFVWRGNSKRKACLLKSSSLWLPKLEPGTISGTVEFDCKKQRSIQEYGFCSCVQLEPDYYDEDFIDLVENPDIDIRVTNRCPDDQGKRCFIRKPQSLRTSSRIFFGNPN